ncbi:MAG: hypothetical protein OHK93_000881 [Ramalina farinacea]|uniref:Coiled-coil domain-containing protein 16 n=1 Tax=Ramalina farinacea TaxID=258253 RepID=A0AA43QRQ9_9LECA|nr:hypothetical protein [Ramalina farinacea]
MDVRSLLRGERASRRIDHPNASYSATGTLECTVCHIPVKSDVDVWDKHLKSTQHAMRAERLRLNQRTAPSKPEPVPGLRDTSNGTKKRKASDRDEDEDSRKRTRPVSNPSRHSQATSKTPEPLKAPDATPSVTSATTAPPKSTESHPPQSPQAQNPAQTIDEAEWAAFERDVATPSPPPPSAHAPSVITAQAAISAGPVSAADLAKQEEEGQEVTRKERREAELEAEKEDATRLLEEEFDEMEGLEERVRRLREKREELRVRREKEREGDEDDVPKRDGGSSAGVQTADAEDDESDDEDFDDWRFGRQS